MHLHIFYGALIYLNQKANTVVLLKYIELVILMFLT
jgi:hypothetical protein